jgi:OmpA-OmpF porin, OOP family
MWWIPVLRFTEVVWLAVAASACAPVAVTSSPTVRSAPTPAHASNALASSDDDRDGIAAWADLCPGDAEDFDDWQDEDGCPDADNDTDGLLDAVDQCPTEPETRNGRDDDDGCPDASSAPLVDSLPVSIDFRRGRADLPAPALMALDRLAAALVAHPEVALIELGGHGDAREVRAGLDVTRATVVSSYLQAHGVATDRMQIKGYGAQPSADPMRRVEIVVRLSIAP